MAYTRGKKESPSSKPPEVIGIPGSSFLAAATYDESNYSLTLDFKNGTQVVHRYVFPTVWQQFKEHPSKGSFYARQIKTQYPSVPFKQGLKVSDLEKAIKEKRLNANKHQAARSPKNHLRQHPQ